MKKRKRKRAECPFADEACRRLTGAGSKEEFSFDRWAKEAISLNRGKYSGSVPSRAKREAA